MQPEAQVTVEDQELALLQRLERTVVATVLDNVEAEKAPALIVELLANMEYEARHCG